MRPCPICKRQAEPPAENPYAPFCARRCKLIDLGNWLDQGYRLDDDAPIITTPERRS